MQLERGKVISTDHKPEIVFYSARKPGNQKGDLPVL